MVALNKQDNTGLYKFHKKNLKIRQHLSCINKQILNKTDLVKTQTSLVFYSKC